MVVALAGQLLGYDCHNMVRMTNNEQTRTPTKTCKHDLHILSGFFFSRICIVGIVQALAGDSQGRGVNFPWRKSKINWSSGECFSKMRLTKYWSRRRPKYQSTPTATPSNERIASHSGVAHASEFNDSRSIKGNSQAPRSRGGSPRAHRGPTKTHQGTTPDSP